MKKIAFVVYRQWGYDIFKKIVRFQKERKDFIIETLILTKEHECTFDLHSKVKNIYTVDSRDTKKIYTILKKHDIDIVCFYSWSWIISKPILNDFTCLCLHPSPLPKYRGGSPIQNQIMNGETESAVSIFKMSEGIDAGDIYQQSPISFLGTVQDVFARMVDIGTVITKQIITDAVNDELVFHPQKNLDKHPPLKRRTPEQSEIKLTEVPRMTFTELNNLVRGLLDPYPNAFIQLQNQKLFVQEVLKYKQVPKDSFIFTKTVTKLPKTKPLFLKLKDGYANIVIK